MPYSDAEERNLLGHAQADIDIDDCFIENGIRDAKKQHATYMVSDILLNPERYTLQYCARIVPPPPRV